MTVVGRQVKPVDWQAKTSGTATYAMDAAPEGTLITRVLRSPYPHARIVRLDVAKAAALPGVHAVITAADFGDVVYEHSGQTYSDRPPLARDRVLFVGQEVAAVAAESAEIAEQAVRLIDVKYRKLRPLLSVPDALKQRAVRLHERETGTNVAVPVDGVWGDEALAASRAVASASGTYTYPRVAHACMEPNTTVAWWHDGRMELWTSSQAPHFVVHELSRVLNLRLDQVVCRDVFVGGGFGSKSKVSEHEALAAKLSMKCGMPVAIEYTRAEELSITKPRHEFVTTFTGHVDADGRLCWFQADVDVDNGAYNHYGPSVMRAGIKQLGSMYRPDAVSFTGRLVDTNLPPGGQFRGYGAPQTALALECVVDQLAEQCGQDPIEFRIRNASTPDSVALAGARIGSNRMAECLHTVRDMIGWDAKKRDRTYGRGVGVAAGMHSSGSYAYPGGNVSAASVEVLADGRVIVGFGGADAGTGQRTIIAQIAAEVLGVDLDRVEVIMSDWDKTPPDMGAWSSRGTHMGGHATRKAALGMRDALRATASALHGHDRLNELDLGALALASEGATATGLRVEAEYIEERMEPYWTGIPTPNISASYTFAAHAVEVEVDVDTGELTIIDYVAAHDIGRAINPGMVKGQIIGGAVQGLGAVLGEELVYEGGRVANDAYVHYPLPRSTSVPNIRAELIEGPEEAGPFDAKSVGEMSIVPPAPAVLNAVYDAIGIRFTSLPLTPDVILNALRERDEAEGRRAPRTYRLSRRPGRWQIEVFRRLYPYGIGWLLKNVGVRWAKRREPRALVALSQPTSTSEATGSLAAHAAGTVQVAGGATDVMVQRQQGLINPTRLVLTSGIDGMGHITELDDGSLRIGAAVTLDQLAQFTREQWPALARLIDSIASPQIRQVATVGGNLGQAKRCWFFRSGFDCYKRAGVTSPCFAVTGDHRFHHAVIDGHRCQAVTPSDLATALTALDAQVLIQGPTAARTISMADLYTGPGELDVAHDELIEAVVIGAGARARRLAAHKVRVSQGDFALVSLVATATVDDLGAWHDPRLVFGAIAPTPWRARSTEKALAGVVPADEVARAALNLEFERVAHPLARNVWKLDAAVGLLSRVVTEWTPHDPTE